LTDHYCVLSWPELPLPKFSNILYRMKFFPILILILIIASATVHSQSSRFQFSGNYVSHQVVDNVIDIVHDRGKVKIDYLADIGFRVRYSTSDLSSNIHSNGVELQRAVAVKLEVRDDSRSIQISAGDDVIVVQKQPLRITFQHRNGLVWAKESFGAGHMGDRVAHVMVKPEGEHYFGVGEKATEFNRTGKAFTQWNTDVSSFRFNMDPVSKSIPFFMGLREGRAWGIYYDNTWRSEIDLGAQLHTHVGFYADGGELRFYLFSGPTPSDVIRKYTSLTGRSNLPPMWTLGVQVFELGQITEPEVYTIANEYRVRKIPIDAIYLNRSHTSDYRSFTWNGTTFPNAAAVIKEMANRGIHVVQSIDPGIKDDAFFDLRNEGITQDVYVKYPDGSNVSGDTWAGRSLFPDFSKPVARQWWGNLHQRGVGDGVSGFILTMNEPRLFSGNTLASVAEYDNEGRGAGQLEMHNQYALLMAKASFDGLRKMEPDKRIFLKSRSGFAGIQRYASVWNGLHSSNWDEMGLTLPMVLGAGISGIPGSGMRIGGQHQKIDADLYARSLQIASVMPRLELNSHHEQAIVDPWTHGGAWERGNLAFLNMRYRLIPTIYTAWWQHTRTGAPIIRPMIWNWPNVSDVLQLEDQFIIGDHLMVAPVLKPGVNERSVYLPEGLWYRYHTREKVTGGQRIVEPAPNVGSLPASSDDTMLLRSMPMFARAGAVIVEREAMEFVNQKPVKELQLQVFAGGNLTSYLYEDDGTSYAHERGKYRALTFVTEANKAGFRIRVTSEGQYDDASIRFSYLIHGLDRKPDRITVNGRNIVYFYEPRTNTIVFKISAGPTELHIIYQ
jgi:alpha-glucosidase